MTEIRCSSCKAVKSVSCFQRNKANANGFHKACRACKRAGQQKPLRKLSLARL